MIISYKLLINENREGSKIHLDTNNQTAKFGSYMIISYKLLINENREGSKMHLDILISRYLGISIHLSLWNIYKAG